MKMRDRGLGLLRRAAFRQGPSGTAAIEWARPRGAANECGRAVREGVRVMRRELSYPSRGTSSGRIGDGMRASGARLLLSPRSGAAGEDSHFPGLTPWARLYRPDGLTGGQFRATENGRWVCDLVESK